MDAVWGLYSELDEYKKILDKITVPSVSLFGLTASSTLFSYNHIFPSQTVFYSGIIISVLTLALLIICIKRYIHFFINESGLNLKTLSLILGTSVFTFSLILLHITKITATDSLPDSIADFSAVVCDVDIKRNFSRLTVEPTDEYPNSPFKIALYYQGFTDLYAGDTIFIHKKISRLNRNSDDSKFLNYYQKGIYFLSSVSDNDITVILKGKKGFRETIKASLKNRINRIFDKETAGIITALFTGNRSSISKVITSCFRDAGVLHILSASGLHVGIAAAIPLFLLIFNLKRRIVMFISLCVVAFYLFLTDMPVSLIRASLMYGLFYIQILFHRKSNALNTLMLTATVINLYAPHEIFSLGFQLSFGATLGIVLFYDLYLKSMNGLPSFIKKSVSLTASAQIFTVPIIMFNLNQINTISIISNIVIIPLAAIFIYSALLSFSVASTFNILTGITGSITSFCYKTLTGAVTFFSELNFNFYIFDNYLIPLLLLSLSLMPLLPSMRNMNFRGIQIILSIVLCTLYFKIPAMSHCNNLTFYSDKSSIEIELNDVPEIYLDIKKQDDADILLKQVTRLNIDIKNITLNNSSSANIQACKKISSYFIIDECRFLLLPDFNNEFKKLISSFERENIKIIFPIN